jgi:phosphatidylserine synthase
MFLTIPTIMTWTRIFAIPLIVGVFYLPESLATSGERNLIATVMFVVFAATDWLDGYLARKLNQTSSCISGPGLRLCAGVGAFAEGRCLCCAHHHWS